LAKKKHKHHAHPSVTLSERAQSRLAAQKKRQRITRWVSIGIVSVVAIVLAVGAVTQWLIPVYLPLQKTVLTVNGREFNAQYVARMINYYTGGDATYSYLYIDPVIEQIQQNELMKQAATELGITVSNDEVKARLKEGSLKDNPTTRDIAYISLLAEKLIDEKFKPDIGTSGEQRQVLAMLLESAAQAETVRTRLLAGESFADITAELSLDSTTITNKGDMGFHPRGILNGLLFATGLEEKVFTAAAGDMSYFYDEDKSKQLGYWIVKVTERKVESDVLKAQTWGILVPTIEKAEEARARLLAGEDFATIVNEVSQDTTSAEKSGDLGLLSLGTSIGAYVSYAFDETIPVGEISQPILTKDSNTTGAYWLYQVKAIETKRAYSSDDIDTLVNAAFRAWLDALTTDPSNIINVVELTDEQKELIAIESLHS